MTDYEMSRYEKVKTKKNRNKRIILVFVLVLIAGTAMGIAMNFIFAKPAAKKTTDKSSKNKSTVKKGNGKTEQKNDKKKPKHPGFDVSQAMGHTFALSEQIGNRPAGSIKESSAGDYIVRRLAEYGYAVEEQPFTMPDGFGSRNIMGSRRGNREGYTIIIGAHYDSPADTRGAVDNASGAGVLLELARVYAHERIDPTIKFLFFGANRPGSGDPEERLQGSRRFVEVLGSMEKREVVGAIVVDSVAQGEVLALKTQETGPRKLKTALDAFARRKKIMTTLLKATDDSDNIPFENAGMSAVWIEWCNAGGGLTTDDKYASVLAGNVGTVGSLLDGFLFGLKSDDWEELKY